ncbi:MAG TPA: branched-chain amino acid ABC transporter substrate-binding protein [Candidatus Dormibacteraeota bacterium]|nr:branched-chain amino acid ABC transporter substrate-binding protein [Candidatus Dormibacteraeota bacterium]
MLRPSAAALAAALALTAGASCLFGGPPAPVIRIGVDLPLKGAEAGAAVPALNGIRYYVQRHPTLDGYSIVLSESDDSIGGFPDPNRGTDNIRAFIDDPLLAAVIGPFDSSVARAEIPLANAFLLGMVSPVTSSPCLTQDVFLPAALSPTRTPVTCKDAGLPPASALRPSGLNNYFRLAAPDNLQGPAAADRLFKTLQLYRVAVISDHESYGQELANSFTARYMSLGGGVVGRLDLSSSTDPVAFLMRMKADGAQAVYYGGVTANRGCEIRSEMLNVFGTDQTIPFVGGDGIAEDPACVRDAGANFAGMYATVPAIDAGELSSAAAVIKGFKSAYPNPRDYGRYTVIAYDAAAVVYDAIDRAITATGGKRPPRATVLSMLATTSGLVGATGTIRFDANGDTLHRVISIVESPRIDRNGPWLADGFIDYSAALPY